jgi:hypothetical protein
MNFSLSGAFITYLPPPLRHHPACFRELSTTRPVGTEILVKDLFFSLPVRRKLVEPIPETTRVDSSFLAFVLFRFWNRRFLSLRFDLDWSELLSCTPRFISPWQLVKQVFVVWFLAVNSFRLSLVVSGKLLMEQRKVTSVRAAFAQLYSSHIASSLLAVSHSQSSRSNSFRVRTFVLPFRFVALHYLPFTSLENALGGCFDQSAWNYSYFQRSPNDLC